MNISVIWLFSPHHRHYTVITHVVATGSAALVNHLEARITPSPIRPRKSLEAYFLYSRLLFRVRGKMYFTFILREVAFGDLDVVELSLFIRK